MAEWEKRDARWIVDDRKDGQNVNQWHWSEKDCMGWCLHRIKELFEGETLCDTGTVKAKVTQVNKVEGEAFLNVRKKKIIPSYELAISLNYSAVVKGEETVSGKVDLPYIAEENHDEDPELQIRPEIDSASARSAKDAIYSNKEVAVFAKIKTFVAEFQSGKPAGHTGSSASQKPTVTDHSQKTPKQEAPSTKEADKVTADSTAKPSKTSIKRGSNKIEIEDTFYASAGDIFDVFTNEARVKAFTQSDATVSKDVDAPFKMFGGSIEGFNREMIPGKKIVQDWRFTTWADGVYSKVTMDIEEPTPGHTVVKLKQEGVPEEDNFGNRNVIDTTRNGWQHLIFFKIKAVFGYGV